MTKTQEEFTEILEDFLQDHTYAEACAKFGLNNWHINMLRFEPNFKLSKKARRRLGVVLKRYPPRTTIYHRWSAYKIATKLFNTFGCTKSTWIMNYLLDMIEDNR